MKKRITIGASVSFYEDVARIRRELTALGFEVFVPTVATEMEEKGSFDENMQRERYSRYTPEEKRHIVVHMFDKIAASDGFLVVNNEKHGMKGYIGPNVLMELTIAVYMKKPIFLLWPMDEKLTAFSEISALQPVIVNGDVSKIYDYLA